MSENTTRIYQNCSPLCAEHLGGDCPGEGCVYAPTIRLVKDEPFEHWGDYDPHLAEVAAELRGFRNGYRDAYAQYRQGVKVGFWLGAGTVFAAMFTFALINWIAR